MNEEKTKKISKFLSLVLRHRPERIGIRLQTGGWVDVDLLLQATNENGRPLDRQTLEYVVANNDKQRFSFSADGRRIRANQGHSVAVDLGYTPVQPPEWLLHGTPTQFLDVILREGLKKMKRHHVHLQTDRALCIAVATRRGKPVLVRVAASEMFEKGYEFFMSENNVWLTDHVPPEFITIEDQSDNGKNERKDKIN